MTGLTDIKLLNFRKFYENINFSYMLKLIDLYVFKVNLCEYVLYSEIDKFYCITNIDESFVYSEIGTTNLESKSSYNQNCKT